MTNVNDKMDFDVSWKVWMKARGTNICLRTEEGSQKHAANLVHLPVDNFVES